MENEQYKELIMGVVSNVGMTVTDIIKAVPQFDGFSNQKVSALVRLLMEDGKLERNIVKGRSYFTAK
jgi:hypothetical protein